MNTSREISESAIFTTTSAFVLGFVLFLISYVTLRKLVNLSKFHFLHLQNRGDNTRISESVPGTYSEGLRKLEGKLRTRHMAMIRNKIKKYYFNRGTTSVEAKKENYKFW